MEFERPLWFFALLALPLLGFLWKKQKPSAVLFSSTVFLPAETSWRTKWGESLLRILRSLAVILLVTAMAHPVLVKHNEKEFVKGIDIVLALDCSSSMSAKDLGKKTRFAYAKDVLKKFIAKRENDQIGLVIFSGRAFTQAPLTVDHDLVQGLLDRAHIGMVQDGTAIGMALGTAVNRLRDSRAKSKVIILLTDGDNNAGVIDPVTAAQIARQFHIRVYTVGLGAENGYRFTVRDPSSGQIMTGVYKFNPELLKKISRITTGSDRAYFNARSAAELERIYNHIDSLEKTRIEVKHFEKKTEIFPIIVLFALLILVVEITLRETILRRLPA